MLRLVVGWVDVSAVMHTPEGMARDATLDLVDVIQRGSAGDVVHVDADTTAAFSAWAMGGTTPQTTPAGAPTPAPFICSFRLIRNISARSMMR